MKKIRVLLIGEHPCGWSGNSHMMERLVENIDQNIFDISIVAVTGGARLDLFKKNAVPIYEAGMDKMDPLGGSAVTAILESAEFDIAMMVGLDVWAYQQHHETIKALRNKKRFVWIWLFPFDTLSVREDWLPLIKALDIPLVYSQYGEKMLKPYVPNIRYFRPALYQEKLFRKVSAEEREIIRKRIFATVPLEAPIFGFVSNNQLRKDPQRLIKAFFEVKKALPEAVLYMHTQMQGWFNLRQYVKDCGAKPGDVFFSAQNTPYAPEAMVELFNSMDVYVLPSWQEGLSWTILEAMKCGVPVIASDTTSHTELVENAGLLIPCTDIAYNPMNTEGGISYIDTKAVNFQGLVTAMTLVGGSPEVRQQMSEAGLAKAEEWCAGTSDINAVLNEAGKMRYTVRLRKKEKKVLFVQHSSAGDVLMSTQCFKGLTERHPGFPLVYMTQKKFQDIVVGNPYISEIVDYDKDEIQKYAVVYNPHGEKILPGGWNNLDVTLYSMYPYFCKVKADKVFIEEKYPGGIVFDTSQDYIIVHTTGGNIKYRSYAYMDEVIEKIGLPAIQIGGALDLKAFEAALDLRGKLSWRETAWLMKRAKAAIVIDSFPSHLAGALGTPAVVLFGPAPARVTRPRADAGNIICLEPNKLDVCPITSNCWGEITKDVCESPCINTITPDQIAEAFLFLLKGD